MKVLFVMEDSFPIENGCPIRNRYLMEDLKSKGLEVLGLTSPFMEILPGEIVSGSEEISGIRYHRSQYINTINGVSSAVLRWARRIRIFRRYCSLLESICREERPDLIHAITSYFNGNAANRVGAKLNIPRLYEVRSIAGSTAAVIDGRSHGEFKYQTVWRLDKKAMIEATRVAPLSESLKRELASRGIPEGKMDVVDNVVDADKFTPLERSRKIVDKYNLEGSTVIGYIGSVRRIEGLSTLIKAAPGILDQCPNVRFMIVGDGEDIKNLKDLVSRQALSDSFIFTGRVPHSQILDYYSVIDIFTIPRVDALVNQTVAPLKPLEIMATEKVVLASDVGGLSEVVEDGRTGVLFRSEDSEDLGAKALELVRNGQRRAELGKNARQWIIENRQIKRIAEQYIPIYEKMLNKGVTTIAG